VSSETIKKIRFCYAQGKFTSYHAFDSLFPSAIRAHSRSYFTPVQVAFEASLFLAYKKGCRVLDIGSGAGKFCILGSLFTDGTFTGLESRPDWRDASESVRMQFGLPRVEFKLGDVFNEDWSPYSGFYLFNPFNTPERVTIHKDEEGNNRSMREGGERVLKKLESMPRGIRVATYHGLGTEMPDTFRELDRIKIGTGILAFYEKI